MKAASISEIKQALKERTPAQLVDLNLRLARYKKENKELLTYLLFEAEDVEGYIQNCKEEITTAFSEINTSNFFFIRKSLRKILRTTNKHIRFTGSKVVEAELLLFFCKKLKESHIAVNKSTALTKLYETLLKKIHAVIKTMHEDLQYDYAAQLNNL